jgi:hypothetical protein
MYSFKKPSTKRFSIHFLGTFDARPRDSRHFHSCIMIGSSSPTLVLQRMLLGWLAVSSSIQFFGSRNGVLLVEAAIQEFTLVIHLEDVDTVSLATGEAVTRVGIYVNGTYPGPSLIVNLGDEVRIKVMNELPSSATTIHFHGQHQKNTYYMDGVPGVTQVNTITRIVLRDWTRTIMREFCFDLHIPYIGNLLTVCISVLFFDSVLSVLCHPLSTVL